MLDNVGNFLLPLLIFHYMILYYSNVEKEGIEKISILRRSKKVSYKIITLRTIFFFFLVGLTAEYIEDDAFKKYCLS